VKAIESPNWYSTHNAVETQEIPGKRKIRESRDGTKSGERGMRQVEAGVQQMEFHISIQIHVDPVGGVTGQILLRI
jgi:hypothetical protein